MNFKNLSSKALSALLMVSLFAQVLVLIPTSAQAANEIFSDNFGNGNGTTNTVSGWVELENEDNDARISDSSGISNSNKKHVRLEEGASITTTIDTTNNENITLSYFWRGNSTAESSDELSVYWKKSSDVTFNLLNTHSLGNETWTEVLVNLPAEAADSSIEIRFVGPDGADDDEAMVDEVIIEGDEVKKITICHLTSSESNPWEAVWVSVNANTHEDHHDDFPYEGPVDDKGKPTSDGDEWCEDNGGSNEPDPETATIVATKIVCNDESLLPNWGNGGPDVTEDTASDFLADHPNDCHEEEWNFEWAPMGTANPGDQVAVAGGVWTSFDGTTEVPAGALVWVREQADDAYIPFSGDLNGDNGWDDVSAEIYCNTDVLNYDNYDWIDPVVAGETYHCVAFNVPEEPILACDPNINLVENGGFETPTVESNNSWNIFTSVPGWTIEWVNFAEEFPTPSLEFHRGSLFAGFNPAEGEQYVELDGDFYGPSDPGEGGSTFIYQKIPTIIGKSYKLSFNFAGRPNTDEANNVLKVFWNEQQIADSPLTASSTGSWKTFSYTLPAITSMSEIRFEDASQEDSLGTFLDNVSLYCIVEDECTPTSGSVVSDENTIVTLVEVEGEDPLTPDSNAIPVSVVPQIQALASGVWGADVADTSAKWVWSEDPYDDDHEVNKWVTFTRTFTVIGTPEAGTLKIASDNSYEVWLNNEAVCADASEDNHSAADECDVSSYLLSGSNTLKVKVKNWALPGQSIDKNPGGLLFNLTWEGKNCGGNNEDPEKIQVNVKKYIDGVPATTESANEDSFNIKVSGSWDGNFYLEGPSFTYEIPNDYLSDENQSIDLMEDDDNVLPYGSESCEPGKYRVSGYTYGNTWAGAANSNSTTTDKVFISNLQNDTYIIVWNETCPEAVSLATVQVCKVDDEQNPLVGWTMMLLKNKVETLAVDSALSAGVNTANSLTAGVPYVAIASGTWNNQNGANPVDAEYSTTDAWVSQMDGYTGYGEGILELEINGVDGVWGPYNSLHTYAQGFSSTTDGTANFRIFDGDTNTHVQNEGWFGDNSGSLTVDIYEGYAGVTASTQDGACVTFNDVPYGEYEVSEIAQEGWGVVTEDVTVDSSNETFTITNTPSIDNGDDNEEGDEDEEEEELQTLVASSESDGGSGGKSGSSRRNGGGGGSGGSGGGSIGGEVLGATTDIPGMPNTGNGAQSFSIMQIVFFSLLFLGLANMTAVKAIKE